MAKLQINLGQKIDESSYKVKYLKRIELVVHLGAARTGTSALQAALRSDDAKLRAGGTICLTPEGFGYRHRDTLRSFTRTVVAVSRKTGPSRLRATFKARRELKALIGLGSFERLILSDENLLGPVFGTSDDEAIYPNANEVLQALSRILKRTPDRIVLVIRPYDEFIASAFAMSAAYAHSRFFYDRPPPNIAAPVRGWPELIKIIATTYPAAKLEVFRTDTSTTDDVRLSLLAETDTSHLSPIERINAAPSVDALKMIASSKPRSKVEIDEIIARHHAGSALHLFSDSQAARLRARYYADINRI